MKTIIKKETTRTTDRQLQPNTNTQTCEACMCALDIRTQEEEAKVGTTQSDREALEDVGSLECGQWIW